MRNTQIVAVAAVAASMFTTALSVRAETIDIVTGGSASLEWTADFAKYNLKTNLDLNEDGNPAREAQIRGYRLWNGRNYGSELIEGGANLRLRRAGLYIYPTDASGDEIEKKAPVKYFGFRDDSPLLTDELKEINFVPTDDPNVFTDYRNPSQSYTLSDDQVALLRDGELRLCCRHTLSLDYLNTVDMTIDGRIDGVRERDVNGDNVVDEKDDFYLFDLVESDTAGVYDMALTEIMSQYLNIGFLPGAFEDGSEVAANWPSLVNGGEDLPKFAAGDVVGRISYSYETGVTAAPVPLPAALPLLAGGLGALGVFARRRKQLAA